jgi:hypothetical protein
MVSNKFKLSIKTSHLCAYEIAHKAGVHPSALSKIVCGIDKVKPNDPRVIAIGKVLGIPANKCFHEEAN